MLQSQHPGYYNHKIDLQKGYGHSCDYYKTTPYLKKFVRDPYPKYVYWENFPNGNINGEGATFRNGFYNLYVKRRSTDDSNGLVRSCYEMTINGNTIDLKVNIVTVTPGPPMVSGLYISETKEYIPAAYGDIVIYLNNSLVDLSQPVTVNVNGVKKFNGMVKPSVQNLVKSCAEYFDPMRLYPAAVEVSVN